MPSADIRAKDCKVHAALAFVCMEYYYNHCPLKLRGGALYRGEDRFKVHAYRQSFLSYL